MEEDKNQSNVDDVRLEHDQDKNSEKQLGMERQNTKRSKKKHLTGGSHHHHNSPKHLRKNSPTHSRKLSPIHSRNDSGNGKKIVTLDQINSTYLNAIKKYGTGHLTEAERLKIINEERVLLKSIKDRKRKERQHAIAARDEEQCAILMYFIMIVFVIMYIYILRPFSVFASLYFIFRISKKRIDEDSGDVITGEYWDGPFYPILGMGIIFILPLLNFIYPGAEIISMQNNTVNKLKAFFFILFEMVVEIPMPFLYENNMYSIFLYGESGIEKMINPWLIFYPTNFILSFWEIIKNLIQNFYFFIVGLLMTQWMQNDYYLTSEYNITLIMVVLNFFCSIYTILFIFYKLIMLCHGLRIENIRADRLKEINEREKVNIETPKDNDYNYY